MMGKYLLILFVLPSIYVASYGYVSMKKGEKTAAAGAYIAAAIPLILAAIMFFVS